MVRRSPQQLGPREAADLTPEQMRVGITKLQRRIDELHAFDITSIREARDPKLLALQASISGTLEAVFGSNTTDMHRYHLAASLDMTNYFAALSGNPTNHYQIQRGVMDGRARAIALLTQAKDTLAENLADFGETKLGRALRAYDGLDLHPEIDRAASQLYRNGHYANAIADAVKALNNFVRLRSDQVIDGTSLMELVFSPNKPILKFNEGLDQSDKDEQRGFMMMFSGAVAGLRNPRAHKFIEDDPEQALEFIAFVSLLAKLLDKAKKASG